MKIKQDDAYESVLESTECYININSFIICDINYKNNLVLPASLFYM